MKSFENKLAVVTGGGGGMGRQLVVQLAAEGCSVAILDISETDAAESAALATADAPSGVSVSTHACDLSDEAAVLRARDEVLRAHDTDHLDLLFNNAAVFGAGSFLNDDRDAWERVFNICWYGVYYSCRAFVPLVVASDEGHVINTSSAAALRSVHGPGTPCTSYGASKAAVKGFTEGLIEDFRTHAPHVGVSVVIPGAVGTDMRANSQRIITGGNVSANVTSGTDHMRAFLVGMGAPVQGLPEPTIARLMDLMESEIFNDSTTEAARTILEGVREGRWRILVGKFISELDEAVRANPETVYDPDLPVSLVPPDLLASVMTMSGFFTPPRGGALDGAYELRLNFSPITARVADGELELLSGGETSPVASVESDPTTFKSVLFKEASLAEAVDLGRLRISGDRAKFERLLSAVAI